ncbi:ribosomal protein S12 methylthiotransferase RimO [Anaerocolumna cellulosilytica]|uniref:Ribosomal protein uS12 methylthiotransferase RimO n=1 Tax=Anaerocolumna cellulosilytica TaxID=433286 RepID=A0A6S6R6L2_9FIRM|nr:30S ribosomal protein S12 methylthiotransferase RimO [Anaerocolumna cellulosilytica]MBB5197595.1 ribosomal protein S12 methylthiotransferase [Anaerocolumna cellulosilytica]BCJ95120.1 ribosomal protein S12 methylthiotransferase RimO [Anaerocolumna cellulosilytica]
MNIFFVSLGCDKNLVDSEVMLGLIRERGYQITGSEEEADVIVVNTCCFINDAKEESINTILEMAEYKKSGDLKGLIVTGCMAQRYKADIQKEITEVDAILGTSSYDEIVKVIDEVMEGGKSVVRLKELDYDAKVTTNRINTTGGYFSYLKIAEGCDKHCTYCIIPKIRGNYRSIPMERLITEAKELVKGGVRELILVAQETTLYGKDIYGEKSLPRLLKELSKIEELEWIRILYCYPEEITDELIEVIKTEKKVCKYLDMPIQHASDHILKKMGRRTSKKELVNIIGRLREHIPDITLRTTLITGFPGETEEDHTELVEFVENMRFDRLGVFMYSKEEDTPAAKMKPQIRKQIKKERQAEIMEVQQNIAFKRAEDMVGHNFRVMIEGKLPEENEEAYPGYEGNVYIGRTYMDAPNVDGYIFVRARGELMSGEFVEVMVTDAKGYDLIGELT